MRIALVKCPVFSPRMPNLGQGYLRSALESSGITVKQFDLNIELYNNVKATKESSAWEYEGESLWTRNKFDCAWDDPDILNGLPFLSDKLFDSWAREILAFEPDIIGFTIYFTSINVSVFLARKLKKLNKNVKIVFGGPYLITQLVFSGDKIEDIRLPLRNLLKIIDFIAIGEGEETMLEIAERVRLKKTMEGCLGVLAFEEGGIVINKLRPLISDLDKLAIPDLSAVLTYNYKDKGFLPILLSRGCPNCCAFCDFPMLDRFSIRCRKPENVVEEMIEQKKRYPVDFFHFNDATINWNIPLLSKIADLMIQKRIKVRWGASASINARMDARLFRKLKDSGCEYLSFGIESASLKVLKAMRKKFAMEDIKTNIKDCHEAGIIVATNWIIGFPTETADDFDQTVRFIENNRVYLDEFDAAVCTIKPHTDIYEKSASYGIKLNNIYNWEAGSNTYEERLRRMNAFLDLKRVSSTERRIGGYFDKEGIGQVMEIVSNKGLAEKQVQELKEREKAAMKDFKSKENISCQELEFIFESGCGKILHAKKESTAECGVHFFFKRADATIWGQNLSWHVEKLSPVKMKAAGSLGAEQIIEMEFEMSEDSIQWKTQVCAKSDISKFELRLSLPPGYSEWASLTESGMFKEKGKKPQGFLIRDISEQTLSCWKDSPLQYVVFSTLGSTLNFTPYISYTSEYLTLIHTSGDIALPDGFAVTARIYAGNGKKNRDRINDQLLTQFKGLKNVRQDSLTLKNGPLEFFFDQGKGRIFYKGIELTHSYGLYASFFSAGTWTDSLGTVWNVEKKEPYKIIAKGGAFSMPIEMTWEIEMPESSVLKFDIKFKVLQNVILTYIDTNLMLNEVYRDWSTKEKGGSLPRKFDKNWQELVRCTKGEAPVIYTKDIGQRKNYPPLRLRPTSFSLDKECYLAIHDTPDSLRSRLIVARRDFTSKDCRLAPGTYTYFSGTLDILKPIGQGINGMLWTLARKLTGVK